MGEALIVRRGNMGSVVESLSFFKSGSGLASGYNCTVLSNLHSSTSGVTDSAITIAECNAGREILYFNPVINCDNYSKITVVGKQTGAGGTLSALLVGVVKTLPTNADDNVSFVASTAFDMSNINTQQTLTVDLSNVDGNCYFAICGFYMSPGSITSVVFE